MSFAASGTSLDAQAGGQRSWQEVHPGVHRFSDSCNVYAISGPQGSLIVNAGSGGWIDHLEQLPARPVALACTHFFRDHSAGARRASELGLEVYVPETEHAIFVDPELHFLRRETYNLRDHYWDHFAPIEGVPDAVPLLDYSEYQLAGLSVRVIPLPGVTVGQIGIQVTAGCAARGLVFCGEAIHSTGRLARIAPLQYGLSDLDGAAGAWGSARRLRALRPSGLLPSLGEPILSGVDDALAELQRNLLYLTEDRPLSSLPFETVHDLIVRCGEDGLAKVSDHVWQSTNGGAVSTFLISQSGDVLAIDYGFELLSGAAFGGDFTSRPGRRRAVAHSIDALERLTGKRGIRCVLPTHYHNDHVAGIPVLQRLFGTECWAPECFADALEHPEALAITCVWPVPIEVTRRLELDAQIQFEEIAIEVGPQTGGHTRFGALVGFECDGCRYAHTGDEFEFWSMWSMTDEQRGELSVDWHLERMWRNEMFRSTVAWDGYKRCVKWLLDWRPEVVLSGHHPPIPTNESFFRAIEDWAEHAMDVYERVAALGSTEAHFGVDATGGAILPYRTHLEYPRPFEVRVVVRNPFPCAARLQISAVVPSDWRAGPPAMCDASARAEVECTLEITPSEPCRRLPFAVDLVANDRPFGQIAEAIVSIGGPSAA